MNASTAERVLHMSWLRHLSVGAGTPARTLRLFLSVLITKLHLLCIHSGCGGRSGPISARRQLAARLLKKHFVVAVYITNTDLESEMVVGPQSHATTARLSAALHMTECGTRLNACAAAAQEETGNHPSWPPIPPHSKLYRLLKHVCESLRCCIASCV